MSWRPKEGWKNPHKETYEREIKDWIKDAEKRYKEDVSFYGKQGSDRGELSSALEAGGIEHASGEAYEAGANAMLVALRRTGEKVHRSFSYNDPVHGRLDKVISGVLIFIPDEKENE